MSTPFMVLLLGSYDPETKQVLEDVREEIAKISTFTDELYIFAVLLDNVEVYMTSQGKYYIIAEFWEDRVILMKFKEGELEDVDEVRVGGLSELDEYMCEKFNGAIRVPILEKLRGLAMGSPLVLLIRHKELTRGGEYIELPFLIMNGLPGNNAHVFVREGIPVSTMLKEFVDCYGIYMSSYKDEEDLLASVRRVVYYAIKKYLKHPKGRVFRKR